MHDPEGQAKVTAACGGVELGFDEAGHGLAMSDAQQRAAPPAMRVLRWLNRASFCRRSAVDCRDPDLLATFWYALLGGEMVV